VALAVFINTMGTGMFLTGGVLFFTRSVGLTATQVGLGLSIAGLVSLFAGIPLGHLADRYGPREVLIATLICEAAAMSAFLVIRSFAFFLAAICVSEFALVGSNACRGAIIQRVGGQDAPRFRALLRSITNAGVAIGALVASFALHADTRAAYLTLFALDTCSFLLSALVIARLPHLAPLPRPAGAGRWIALRDVPYLAVTAINGLLSLHTSILLVVLPLWVAAHTGAPRWVVAASFVVNTAMIVMYQVRASRAIRDPAEAGRALRRSGFVFLVACLVFATTGWLSPWAATAVLLVGVASYTVGELWQQAGAFELSFGLANDYAVGQYQGVFALGQGLAQALGPALLTVLCLGLGAGGWLAVGCFLVVTGILAPPLVRHAVARRLPLRTVEPGGQQ
jgi:MFS family permease